MTLQAVRSHTTTPPPLMGPASVCEIGPRCTEVAVVAVSNGLKCRSRRACVDCLPDAILDEALEPGEPARLTVVRLG